MRLLKVEDLWVSFQHDERSSVVLEGVSIQVHQQEVVALVGESGCGKTMTALSIMGILPPNARAQKGRILLNDTDLLRLEEEELQGIRGKDIAMIFQEPMTSLNPVFTIGDQIEEAILTHEPVSQEEARERAVLLLSSVGIPDPASRLKDYPHQLSGGQRQRVMIAMALACHPRLLIADEPTTALDVTIQAQILDLFSRLQQEHRMGLIYITHDLAVVAHIAHRVYVMYCGMIVEEGEVRKIFKNPMHPYTRGLLASLPSRAQRGRPLPTLGGQVPDPSRRPHGCPFHPRCPQFLQACAQRMPPWRAVEKGHRVRCYWVAKDG